MARQSGVSTTGVVDASNSTTDVLGISETFTGDWRLVTPYASIFSMGAADQPGTIFAEFSIDAVTVDRTVRQSIGADGDFGIHGLVSVARYFRIRVVNEGVAQTSFRLQTTLHANSRVALPTSRISQVVGEYSDVLNVRIASDPELDVVRKKTDRIRLEFAFSDSSVTTTEGLLADGAPAPFLLAPDTVRIKAGGNVNDTAGGSGAVAVQFQGLSDDGILWLIGGAQLATAGASASAPSSASFIRVWTGASRTSGTYATGAADVGANAGAMVLETTGGIELLTIAAGKGQGYAGFVTIPDMMVGVTKRTDVNVSGSKDTTVECWRRDAADDVVAPFRARRRVRAWDELSGFIETAIPEGFFESRTDLWFSGKAVSGTSAASVHFEVILYPIDET